MIYAYLSNTSQLDGKKGRTSIKIYYYEHVHKRSNRLHDELSFKAISFANLFLADILTSMAKVFSDLEHSVSRMVHRQVATITWLEADFVCGSHLSLALSFLRKPMPLITELKDLIQEMKSLKLEKLKKPVT